MTTMVSAAQQAEREHLQELARKRRIRAAANDMLAALKAVEAHHIEINNRLGRPLDHSHTLKIVRAAIAKAEGNS